jgi:hypothetical protein
MKKVNTKRVTLGFLEKHDACEEGVEYWETLPKEKRYDPVWLINHAIDSGDEDLLNHANWLITRVLSRKNALRYPVFAARQVLHLEKNQDSALKAIEAAEAVIKKDSEVNREKARKAASAASDAAYAAYTAAYAAYTAADAAVAAAAAADAADAAADAADAADAAADADPTAARKEMKIKILKYGLELLK